MKLNYFNFKDFGDRVLLTNDFGNHLFLDRSEFETVITGNATANSALGEKLLSSRMAYEGTNLSFLNENLYNLREAKRYAATATSLHIFVVTTACNLGCVYCQANNGMTCSNTFMSREIAEKAVDIALQSPEKNLTFEFQGGEPLLNFDIIKTIVEYAENNKGEHHFSYSIVSNLTLLTEEILDYLIDKKFGISTSIDGHQILHDHNRPFKNGTGSFCTVSERLCEIHNRGAHIGAIETTTRSSLSYPKEIIDTYVKLGFTSIFLRPLTPLGKALASWDSIGYTPEEFLKFYREALQEIIRINKSGIFLREEHATIFLRKIAGEGINYMELRSPCGGGIGQIAYYCDGRIFTCDEGRMLAEMGDNSFYLGNVYQDTYKDLVSNKTCRSVCAASVLESIPSCCDCVYQPYCGVCPVVNYAMYKDIIEKEPHSYKCQIHSGILDYIFALIKENDKEIIDILDSWRK